VIEPQNKESYTIPYSEEVKFLIQNSCLASKLAYEEDPQAWIQSNRSRCDLIYGARARDDVLIELHRWIVCTSRKASDGSLTWFISFRGTANLSDILADLNFIAVRTTATSSCRGHVHKGFLQQGKTFDPKFLDPILEISNDRVVLCGHSLGGNSYDPHMFGIENSLLAGAAALLAFVEVLSNNPPISLNALKAGR
jgi:hypothetical protein